LSHRIPSGSFDRATSSAALWSAWLRTRRGKRRSTAAAVFELEAERGIFALQRALASDTYFPRQPRVRIVHDPKRRAICVTAFRDRVVHQAVHAELAPHYDGSLVDHSYAGAERRGSHRAVLRYLESLRRNRWRLALDIHRFFPSVVHELLLGLLFRRLADRRMRRLLEILVRSAEGLYHRPELLRAMPEFLAEPVPPGVGIPIGTLLSQWGVNHYLCGLDHFVKRELKVRWYQRYMDDLTLFGDDRGRLEQARGAIADWLWNERRLRLNPRRWDVHPTSEPSVYLGFRVTRAGIAMGPKARRRLRARLALRAAAGPEALEATLLATRGMALFG